MSTVKLNVLVDKLDTHARSALESAVNLCVQYGHYNIEIEHWLLCLLQNKQSVCHQLLDAMQCDINQIIVDLKERLWTFQAGNEQTPTLSGRVIDLINESWLMASLHYQNHLIHSGFVLLVLYQDAVLKQLVDRLSPSLQAIHEIQVQNALMQWQQELPPEAEQQASTVTSDSALKQYTINLNTQVKQGKIDQAIGRELEISQIIDILARRRQNNAILTGEPGVGKTAIVEGLACRIVAGDVPLSLKSVEIHALDLGLLQAGASVKGEFERRLKGLIQEIKQAPQPIILFIDEAHTLIGSGAVAGQADAANLLKPALARGELRCIAATTWSEYKQYFEKDAALVRRFQIVKVEEPDAPTAMAMVRSLCASLEAHHGVRILEEAVQSAVLLSQRYIHERQLPDKAISVLDTASARVALQQSANPKEFEVLQKRLQQLELEWARLEVEKNQGMKHPDKIKSIKLQISASKNKLDKTTSRWKHEKKLVDKLNNEIAKLSHSKSSKSIQKKITEIQNELNGNQQTLTLVQASVDHQAIASVIADWVGVPVGNMLENEVNQVLNLSQSLQQKIMGQQFALSQVSEILTTAFAELADPNKPIGVFMFVGPSGVGKTETAAVLAEKLFGSQDKITVINMSEFKEAHKVSMLVGSPPGYVGYGEGGVLTEAVRRKPYSIILLDEMEKAHPSVQDVFYQVFDKGVIKDGQGRDVSFKNSLIIMTSNAGSDLISALYQAKNIPSYEKLIDLLQPELRKIFKPAFLGRINLIPYLPLSQQNLVDILNLKLLKIKDRLESGYNLLLLIDASFIDYVLTHCDHDDLGARQIDNIVTKKLLPVLSQIVLTEIMDKKSVRKILVKVNEKGEISCDAIVLKKTKPKKVAA